MTGHTPTPLVLDTTVLRELARGDGGTINLVQSLDQRGQPMVVPALAVTGALIDTRTEDAVDAMVGLALLDQVLVAPVKDSEQAARLAEIVAVTNLDAWDAHTAAVADASICPILTTDASRWRRPAAAMDERLHVIEIADPGEAGS